MYFDNKQLNIPKFTNGLTEGEMVIVFKIDSESASYGGFHKWGNSSGQHYLTVAKFMKTLVEIQDGWNPVKKTDRYHIYSVSSKSNEWIARINNYLKRSETGGSVSWGESNTLGKSTDNGWYGHIQEVLFFDEVLSEQDRFKIHYYLANKWGLQEEVDSDGDGEMDITDKTLGMNS